MKIVIFLILLSTNIYAEGSLHAHEHGTLALEVGVEGKVAEFTVDGPAESFLGFEYAPKTAKDKKVMIAAKDQWEKAFFELVQFDRNLGCKLSDGKFEQKFEGKGNTHSDIEASIKVTCEKELKGQKVVVFMKKKFKNIKKLKIDLIGNNTKSIQVNSENFEVTL